MSEINLKFFMVESLNEDEIVEVPGINTFKDDKGKPVPFQIKKLGVKRLNDIRKGCKVKKLLKNGKGKQMFNNLGEPMFETDYNSDEATAKIIVESLVFPYLADKELMEFYKCVDVLNMPMKLFKEPNDFKYVSEQVLLVNGITSEDEEEQEEKLIEEAKN